MQCPFSSIHTEQIITKKQQRSFLSSQCIDFNGFVYFYDPQKATKIQPIKNCAQTYPQDVSARDPDDREIFSAIYREKLMFSSCLWHPLA